MDKERNCHFEMKQNGMMITFLFPPKTGKEDNGLVAPKSHSITANTKKEIKNILTTILPEYLTKGGISP